MAEGIAGPAEISPHAPRIESIKINPEKIGNVIGPGGKIIKGIQAETGAEINIEDDGTVRIYAIKKESLDRALEMVNNITAEIEIDKMYIYTCQKLLLDRVVVEVTNVKGAIAVKILCAKVRI